MRAHLRWSACIVLLLSVACSPQLPDDLPGLMDAMGSTDMRVQWAASEKVKRVYGEQGLLTALEHPNPGTRARAAHWLAHFRGPAVQDALLKACLDEDAHVRMWAVYSLGEIADDSALAAVRDLEQDPSESVRREAANALKKIEARSQDEVEGRG